MARKRRPTTLSNACELLLIKIIMKFKKVWHEIDRFGISS